MFYTDLVNACSVGLRDDVLFLRTGLGFGGTATGHFHLRNIKAEDMSTVVQQINLVGVVLFSDVNTSVGIMLHNLRTEI